MATGVYIDGLNFYYGALKGTPYKWLDLEKFVRLLLPRDEISVIRYFTATINKRHNDDGAHSRQAVYLRALRANPNIMIHKGHFRNDIRWKALADNKHRSSELFKPSFRPLTLFNLMWKDNVIRREEQSTLARVVIDEEKGSDVNLGVHLIDDCARGLCDKALIVSNDSDLVGAIRLAKGFANQVGILNPHSTPTNRRLRDEASFEIPFRPDALAKCQLPQIVDTPRNGHVHRPKMWR